MLCPTDIIDYSWFCHCGTKNHESAETCKECELPEEQEKIHHCPKCEDKTAWDSGECHSCGADEMTMCCRDCDEDTLHRANECVECGCVFDMEKSLKQAINKG